MHAGYGIRVVLAGADGSYALLERAILPVHYVERLRPRTQRAQAPVGTPARSTLPPYRFGVIERFEVEWAPILGDRFGCVGCGEEEVALSAYYRRSLPPERPREPPPPD